MSYRMLQRRYVVPLAGLVAIVLLASPIAAQRSLKILLTNDDGYESAGVKVMHEALTAAGHQVTLVAPATNQSSTSMSMTSGVVKVENKGNRVYAVHGSPADAAMIGLMHVLRDTPQDLVVSGTNAGANLGSSTNGSGTVSAAIAASRYGVPAIATSAGIGPNAANAYAIAASLVTQMIAALDAGRGNGKLLPERLVINVNVPAVAPDRVLGLKWAPLSPRSAYRREYSTTDNPDEVRSRLVGSGGANASEADTDLALFGQGYVTLTLLDGDLSVDAKSSPAAALIDRLAKIALPQPAAR